MNACETLLFRTSIAWAFVIAGVFARDALAPPRAPRIAAAFARDALAPPPPPASPPADKPSALCVHDKGMVTLSRPSFEALFDGPGCSTVPAFEKGRFVGIKTFRVRPDSEAARAGIQNGDVLVRIDDRPVMDIDASIALWQRLDEGGCGTLTWQRGEAQQTLHVH